MSRSYADKLGFIGMVEAFAQTKIVGTVRPIPLRYMTVRSKHNEIYIFFNIL